MNDDVIAAKEDLIDVLTKLIGEDDAMEVFVAVDDYIDAKIKANIQPE